MLEEHLLTSPNRAYLAMCLWHFVQICFANVPQTSDTLITLYAIDFGTPVIEILKKKINNV